LIIDVRCSSVKEKYCKLALVKDLKQFEVIDELFGIDELL